MLHISDMLDLPDDTDLRTRLLGQIVSQLTGHSDAA